MDHRQNAATAVSARAGWSIERDPASLGIPADKEWPAEYRIRDADGNFRCVFFNPDEMAAHFVLALQELDRLWAALFRSPYDIVPCSLCGNMVVSIPEGVAVCDECGCNDDE